MPGVLHKRPFGDDRAARPTEVREGDARSQWTPQAEASLESTNRLKRTSGAEARSVSRAGVQSVIELFTERGVLAHLLLNGRKAELGEIIRR